MSRMKLFAAEIVGIGVCLCAIALCPGCGVEGIHAAKPLTRVVVDPMNREVRYEDSKDNDLTIKDLKFAAGDKSGSVAEMTLRNNASDVRRANVEQMDGMARQAAANWQGANGLVAGLAQVLSEVMPYLPKTIAASALSKVSSLTGPYGLGYTAGPTADLLAQVFAAQESAINAGGDSDAVAAMTAAEIQALKAEVEKLKAIATQPAAESSVTTQPVADDDIATAAIAEQAGIQARIDLLKSELEWYREAFSREVESNTALSAELAELRGLLAKSASGKSETGESAEGAAETNGE